MSPLLLALVVVQSTVYVWTDKSGVEHFTDDPTSIPRGAKVRTTEGTEISRIESDLVKNPRPVVALAAPAEPAVPSTSEQTWRQLFRDARTRVIVLEEDIEADRKTVEEVNGLPVSARFTCATGWWGPPAVITTGAVVFNGQLLPAPCVYGLNPESERVRERLDKNRREVVRAREDLADLERRASFEAVPLHWRR